MRRRFVLTRLSREAGRPVDQMTTVLDLTGMGMRHISKEAVSYTRRISHIFQDNYSGMTCKLLVVNAPWVFSKGWQIIEGGGGANAEEDESDCKAVYSLPCRRVGTKTKSFSDIWAVASQFSHFITLTPFVHIIYSSHFVRRSIV